MSTLFCICVADVFVIQQCFWSSSLSSCIRRCIHCVVVLFCVLCGRIVLCFVLSYRCVFCVVVSFCVLCRRSYRRRWWLVRCLHSHSHHLLIDFWLLLSLSSCCVVVVIIIIVICHRRSIVCCHCCCCRSSLLVMSYCWWSFFHFFFCGNRNVLVKYCIYDNFIVCNYIPFIFHHVLPANVYSIMFTVRLYRKSKRKICDNKELCLPFCCYCCCWLLRVEGFECEIEAKFVAQK